MAEYIERGALLRKIKQYGLSNGSVLGKHSGAAEELILEVESFPSADVAPVRRGKWGCYNPFCGGYPCSSCKLIHRTCTAYCPNCGAKMEANHG